MHTSLEVHPRTHCVSCEGECPTVPSPLVGEGQGGGCRRETELEACLAHKLTNNLRQGGRACSTPLPVPPPTRPHKGGGNAVALLCPTPGSIPVFVRRCVHTLKQRGMSLVRPLP